MLLSVPHPPNLNPAVRRGVKASWFTQLNLPAVPGGSRGRDASKPSSVRQRHPSIKKHPTVQDEKKNIFSSKLTLQIHVPNHIFERIKSIISATLENKTDSNYRELFLSKNIYHSIFLFTHLG